MIVKERFILLVLIDEFLLKTILARLLIIEVLEDDITVIGTNEDSQVLRPVRVMHLRLLLETVKVI